MLEVFYNVQVASLNSWKIPGTVACLIQPHQGSSLQDWLKKHPEHHYYPLGLGSNILFPDEHLDWTLVHLRQLQKIEQIDVETWEIEAGVSCAKVARIAAMQGFRDAAFLCGIPGTLGGALAMNAGAYGGEMWQVVEWAEGYAHDGTYHRFQASDLEISYRSVIFPKPIILTKARVRFRDPRGESQQFLIAQWLAQRSQTQPIGLPSCGSVFKNPYPNYAGQLIEACGLKGMRMGGAMVSPKHANFIINAHGASSADVKALIKHVQACVMDRFSIMLEPEVIILKA